MSENSSGFRLAPTTVALSPCVCQLATHRSRLRKEVCDQFVDEIAAFLAHLEAQKVPVQRPNSMNKYGLIMRHMGMTTMMV